MIAARSAVASLAMLAVLGLALAPVLPALAHGYLSTPPSRQAQCRAGTVSGCGPIIYEPQSVEAVKGLRSCNGGIANWAPLADESKAWPVTSLSAGVNTFRWTLTAVHLTASWEYYIGNTRLALITGSSTTHSVDLSGYSGKQKILAIWNIGDTVNAFYSCVDVNIGGTSSSSPTTTTAPTTAPTSAPTSSPTTAPTSSPTTAPTSAPTTSPTTTVSPIGGTTFYTVRRGDSLGAIASSRRITLAALLAVNPEITNPDLIYVNQRIRIPARSSRLNETDDSTTAGFGFTGPESLTDNAVDLTSTGVGSHWWAGIQKNLKASAASSTSQHVVPTVVVATVVGVLALVFGQ